MGLFENAKNSGEKSDKRMSIIRRVSDKIAWVDESSKTRFNAWFCLL